MLRECAGTEDSRNLATGEYPRSFVDGNRPHKLLPVAKFRGNFAVSTTVN
ncbi:MAG: hypothetical protein HC903_31215 [Methylacidiphilales bacterium]|nr:hypothetical protein [Candidatus Methylacidiphilales bacterium]NJR19967.1 hypothetical protein [Calothrix sp. CSU_2_0]